MTDFLDRLVARVLPVPGGGRVVQTRPRSRFEEPWLEGADPGGDDLHGDPTSRGAQEGDGARTGVRGGGESTGRGAVVPPTDASQVSGSGRQANRRLAEGAIPMVRGRSGAVSPESWPSGNRAPEAGRSEGEEARPGRNGGLVPQAPPPPSPESPPSAGGDLHHTPFSQAARSGWDTGEAGVEQGSPAPGAPSLHLRPQSHPGTGGDRTPAGGISPEGSARTGGASVTGVGADAPSLYGSGKQPVLRPTGATASRPPVDPTPPPIQLRIGRLEIRDSAPAPAPLRTPVALPQPRLPALDLAEYLRRRSTGREP